MKDLGLTARVAFFEEYAKHEDAIRTREGVDKEQFIHALKQVVDRDSIFAIEPSFWETLLISIRKENYGILVNQVIQRAKKVD